MSYVMKTVFRLVLCLLPLVSFEAGAKQWTLRECIDYARINNIQVRNAQLNQAVAEQTLMQAQL